MFRRIGDYITEVLMGAVLLLASLVCVALPLLAVMALLKYLGS